MFYVISNDGMFSFHFYSGGLSASVRAFQCSCNTSQCRDQNRTTCEGAVMCYTQYLKRRDGSDPITKGCLPTKTSLLCENRRPAVANWPILVCCKNNMCNEQLPMQLAHIIGPQGYVPAHIAAGSSISKNHGTNSVSRNTNDGRPMNTQIGDSRNNANAKMNSSDAIEDPHDEETEIDFKQSNSASQDISSNSDHPGANTFVDSNKFYNNRRFLDTIRPTASGNDVNGLHPVIADSSQSGLTAFHVAIFLISFVCLFLLFLLGFAILRRQARLFSGAPYLVGQPVYSKEQPTLTQPSRNCAPSRLSMPAQHTYVGNTVPAMHHQPVTMVSPPPCRGNLHGTNFQLDAQQQQLRHQSMMASNASYDKLHS
ncbi:hypothetical protein BIW11_06999 [Tropilaelaps mercedesae]|uniref:Activin types I and II receptor domain-containing protein n=1 Tax=Tropilaelaps mercedesae TaxID=418985 RepID=A0A1V9XW34_9ACAR|nr:hypothetical protein BIW11_06999 [Tropilaelaps mercedesae]